MPRNDEDDVEQLVETIKAHCPNIANNDPDGSKVRWFAEAIVIERTQGVTAHKRNEHHEVLQKLATAISRVEELTKNLPDGAKEVLRGCLPEKRALENSNATVAAMEEALGLNQSSQVELSEFLNDLAQTSQNLEQFLTNNSEKKRRRKTFDYEAMMVYRKCLQIWGEEVALKTGGPTGRFQANQFIQNYESAQGLFTEEVFNTLGIRTNVSSAAKRLHEEGGEERLQYNLEISRKPSS